MIPGDLRRRILADFGEAAAPGVEEELARFAEAFAGENGGAPPDRILRAVVHLAAGDREALRLHCRDARVDWRDVIVAAEYDRTGARLRDFRLPFPERMAGGPGSPESVVAAFIAAMNDWERAAYAASREARNTDRPDSFWPGVRAGCRRVFAELCTPREDTGGREDTFSASPEYDPARERIVGSAAEGDIAHVDTEREAELGGGLYRYALRRRDGRWLIHDLAQRTDDGWEPAVL